MNVTLVIPPVLKAVGSADEDKHGGFGRRVIPYTMAQIHALIEKHIPEASIAIVEAQRDGLDAPAARKMLDETAPDIVVAFLAWSHINWDRCTAETEHPTIGVILQQYIDQKEAVEIHDLKCNWFTKQEVEMPLVDALKEFMETGDIVNTPGFLRRVKNELIDTGDAPLADLTTFPMPSFEAIEVEKYFALREADQPATAAEDPYEHHERVPLPVQILRPGQSGTGRKSADPKIRWWIRSLIASRNTMSTTSSFSIMNSV